MEVDQRRPVASPPLKSPKTGPSGGVALHQVKIALSLYKVQQNIYLLDFQRLDVRYSLSDFIVVDVGFCILLTLITLYAVTFELAHFFYFHVRATASGS